MEEDTAEDMAEDMEVDMEEDMVGIALGDTDMDQIMVVAEQQAFLQLVLENTKLIRNVCGEFFLS